MIQLAMASRRRGACSGVAMWCRHWTYCGQGDPASTTSPTDAGYPDRQPLGDPQAPGNRWRWRIAPRRSRTSLARITTLLGLLLVVGAASGRPPWELLPWTRQFSTAALYAAVGSALLLVFLGLLLPPERVDPQGRWHPLGSVDVLAARGPSVGPAVLRRARRAGVDHADPLGLGARALCVVLSRA